MSAEIFFSDAVTLFAPETLIEELDKHTATIIARTNLSPDEITTMLVLVKNKVTIIPLEAFSNAYEQAITFCPDPKDIAYLGLALHLNCGLWSNDKALKTQKVVPVYATHDLVRLIKQ